MPTLAQSFSAANANRFNQIRLAAATIVIISHSWPLFGRPDEPFKWLNGHESGGEAAVTVFFVVSGFLIYCSAERSKDWISFAFARMRRIIPGAAVCALFCMFVVGPAFTRLPMSEYFTNVHTWLFLKNVFPFQVAYKLPGVFENNFYPKAVNGSLWTLPLEIFLYVACGLTCFLLPNKLLPPILAATCFALSYWIFPAAGNNGFFFWLSYLGCYFFSGVTMYVWRDRITLRGSVVLVLGAIYIASFRTPYFSPAQALFIPYAVMWLAFTGLDQQDDPKPNSFPDISYGLYIYAFPVQQSLAAAFGHSLGFVPLVILSLAITISLATLSFFYVERPFLQSRTNLLLATS